MDEVPRDLWTCLGHALVVGLTMLGLQLDLMILEGISNLNDFMVLWCLGSEMAAKNILGAGLGVRWLSENEL